MSNEHEHSDKFSRTDFSIVETSEKTKNPEKQENKLLTELQSLKVSHDDIKKPQSNSHVKHWNVHNSSRLANSSNNHNTLLGRRASP